MLTPIENIFQAVCQQYNQAVCQQQYDDVISLIENTPELVNAKHPKTGSSLLKFNLNGVQEPNHPIQHLLEYIVTHPKFDLDFKNNNGFTNLTHIIFTSRVDILTLVIKNPKVLMNGDQLTYEYAKKQLQLATGTLQRDINKDPNSKSSERSKVRVANLTEMVEMLRDATILAAMEQDNPELLDLLDKAGGKPTDFLGKLGNEELPAALVEKSNVNVIKWFDKQLEKTDRNRNAFWEKIAEKEKIVQKLEEKEAALKKEYHTQRTNLHIKEIKSTVSLIEEMQSKLKF